MVRRSLLGLTLLFLCGGFVLAETFKGKIDKLDVDKKTGAIRDDKGPHPFKVTAETKIVDADGKDIPDGLKALKVGDEISVTTEGKGKKAMTKEIKVSKKSADKDKDKEKDK